LLDEVPPLLVDEAAESPDFASADAALSELSLEKSTPLLDAVSLFLLDFEADESPDVDDLSLSAFGRLVPSLESLLPFPDFFEPEDDTVSSAEPLIPLLFFDLLALARNLLTLLDLSFLMLFFSFPSFELLVTGNLLLPLEGFTATGAAE